MANQQKRERFSVSMPPAFLAAVDEARGTASRSEYIRRSVEHYFKVEAKRRELELGEAV